MAITAKVSMTDSENLFNKLLPAPNAELINTLIKDGKISVKFGFYNVSFSYGSHQVLGANLSKSIPSLQSIAKNSHEAKLCGAELNALVNELCQELGYTPLDMQGAEIPYGSNLGTATIDKFAALKKIVAAGEVKVPDLAPLAKSIDQLSIAAGKIKLPPNVKIKTPAAALYQDFNPDFTTLSSPKKAAAKIVGIADLTTPVNLRDAKSLTQPVKSTTEGTVYYVAALSSRVKLAIRYRPKQQALSFRVEGKPTPLESNQLVAAGMQKNNSYFSMHMQCNGVPAPRVIGAFLMGLGIEFDEQITQAGQIKAEK